MFFKSKKQEEKKALLLRENIRTGCPSQPHGIEAAKKEIKASGIAVITFQDRFDWNSHPEPKVIGMAGVGKKHLEILSVITSKSWMTKRQNVRHRAARTPYARFR